MILFEAEGLRNPFLDDQLHLKKKIPKKAIFATYPAGCS